jgi:cytochrome c553
MHSRDVWKWCAGGVLGLALAGCGGSGGADAPVAADSGAAAASATPAASATEATTKALPVVTTVHPGRLLASNCFNCHGTDGHPAGGFDALAGASAQEIYGEMKEMQTKPDAEKGIMRLHALGYTDAQIWQLADYFARQPR